MGKNRKPIHEPTGAVRLSDGRRITYWAIGPEDGFPVVYCHGAIGSPRWRVPLLAEVTERLSVRYLVVNRPGFSGSDASTGRTVVDFAHDLGELMASLQHARFSVVGVSAGAPYALACGHILADKIVSLAAVSALGPAAGPGASPGLRYQVPLVPYGSPHVGPLLVRLTLRALRLHRQTPATAMIDDYLVCRDHWGFRPTDLRVPVMIWHGRADRLVPLRHAMTLAAVIPRCSTVVESRAGHFFYGRRMADVIASVLPDEQTASAAPLDMAQAA